MILILSLLSCNNFSLQNARKGYRERILFERKSSRSFNNILKASPNNIMKILSECNDIKEKTSQAIFAALQNGNIEVFKEVCKKTNIFSWNEDRDTVFHVLIKENNLAFLKVIQKSRLSIALTKCRDGRGRSILDLAMELKRKELLKYIKGCNIVKRVDILREAIKNRDRDKVVEISSNLKSTDCDEIKLIVSTLSNAFIKDVLILIFDEYHNKEELLISSFYNKDIKVMKLIINLLIKGEYYQILDRAVYLSLFYEKEIFAFELVNMEISFNKMIKTSNEEIYPIYLAISKGYKLLAEEMFVKSSLKDRSLYLQKATSPNVKRFLKELNREKD